MTKVVAGPLCTQYLGDMGAEIIKIEPPQGDDTRRWPPFHEDEGNGDRTGTVFLSMNRNKRSFAVDLKTAEGQSIVQQLIQSADVVVESYATGVTERLGVDYETVRKVNPGLIYCSISGFGRNGPMKNAKGYDLILQAYSGIMAMTGVPGGPPIRTPLSPIDQATGLNAQNGILAALFHRERTGEGAYLEVSLFETALALLAFNLQRSWRRGTPPEKSGTGHESLCPYEVFQASNGDVLIGIANDSLWQKYCEAVERPELASEARFLTNADRVRNRKETNGLVREITRSRTIEEWVAALNAAGVPCVPVNTALDVLRSPQTAALGMVINYDHPQFGELKAIANPVHFAGDDRGDVNPPPALGQDTSAILRDLGRDQAEIDRLIDTKVVSTPDRRG
ncbi:CoA transferase [Amorphus sp. 3PC139-8]